MNLTLALIQYNFNVGFIAGNTARIGALYGAASAAEAGLVVFSEMAVTGYPPEDLVLSSRFQELSMEAVQELAQLTTQGSAMLVGGVWREGAALYNAVFLLEGGRIIHRQYKHRLPNYGIFDEKRVFEPGPMPEPVEWRGIKLGLLICEDMWQPEVAAHLKGRGAELFICMNASPYEVGKAAEREAVAARRVQENRLPLVYVNQVGGQDELVFDGGCFAFDAAGALCLRMHAFKEDIGLLSLNRQGNQWMPGRGEVQHQPEALESMYHAMMLGLKDFVDKNGYSGVVIGISGGIDSALSAAIAVDALGSERVHLVFLPSPITSRESGDDAAESAKRLGTRFDVISIEAGMQAFDTMLSSYGETAAITVACNQTRLRAGILLAISAKEKALLLNTGNKSELATGFTTLYGDMAGHYGVLKDIYKTTAYKLAHWRNGISAVVPEYTLSRPPSAEIMPGEVDQDTLPPYDILDEILVRMVDLQLSAEEVAAQGFDPAVVEQVSLKLFGAEYKRRQSAPGVRLSGMSFGRDRRYPLTSAWQGKKVVLPPA